MCTNQGGQVNELLMIIIAVLYAAIGSFVVVDAWFDFRISYRIRKLFRK